MDVELLSVNSFILKLSIILAQPSHILAFVMMGMIDNINVYSSCRTSGNTWLLHYLTNGWVFLTHLSQYQPDHYTLLLTVRFWFGLGCTVFSHLYSNCLPIIIGAFKAIFSILLNTTRKKHKSTWCRWTLGHVCSCRTYAFSTLWSHHSLCSVLKPSHFKYTLAIKFQAWIFPWPLGPQLIDVLSPFIVAHVSLALNNSVTT